MKNIHILPTDKPSRLHEFGGVWFSHKKPTECFRNYNIYITNSEGIKEGDWVVKISSLYKGGGIPQKYSFIDAQFEDIIFKKIILTTDQDLIKDGVQAIDDEFLEWFVKNTSCENVKVFYDLFEFEKDSSRKQYKIIIPKEEPKQEVTGVDDNRPKPNYCYAKEQGHGEIGCVFPACHCGLPIKQETLEEVAKIWVNNRFTKQICGDESYPDIHASKEGIVESHIIFAKWQQERMYSEEEVRKLCSKAWLKQPNTPNMLEEFDRWFERNKKK